MLRKILTVFAGFALLVGVVSVYAANFTYDGINRRDPVSPVEQRVIAATGDIRCTAAKTGQTRISTGFLLDIGQGSEFSLLITSGHSFRDISDNEFHPECSYQPFGRQDMRPLVNRRAGDLVHPNPADFIKNDWGADLETGLASGDGIPISNRSFNQLMSLLEMGLAEVKLYAGNRNPVQGDARIQVSDSCSVWKPTPRAILGAGHSLYTNCDATGSSSGGPLVVEFIDGRVEAIGIMFGAIHTVETVNRLLGDDAATRTIADIEDAISEVPSPETIINVAVSLLPGMRSQSLDDFLSSLQQDI